MGAFQLSPFYLFDLFVSALTTLTKFEEANPKPDSENAQISEKWYVELGVATYKTYKDIKSCSI